MKVLITGATGFIGKALVKQCLSNGIEINYLTTSREKLETLKGCTGFYWNPSKNEIDVNCFNRVDAIFHLSGASVSKRWTRLYKEEIINSRINSIQLLIKTLKTTNHEVKHVISASAIGIYPTSLINFYNEKEKKIGSSFLATVVQQWENEVNNFKNLNINVSIVRIGLVLSTKGGVLPKMLLPFKYSLGSSCGSGNQWQSWIHLEDLINIFLHVLKLNLAGVYNAVSPNAVTNLEFTRVLAKELNSTLWLPKTPRFLLKMVLGEMHQLLFLSQKVSSKKIESTGFTFKYNQLKDALNNLLN